MTKFPFFKQLDAMDCGPASLKIICKFYGKDLSMKYIRDKCNIDREGVSMLIFRCNCATCFGDVVPQKKDDFLAKFIN